MRPNAPAPTRPQQAPPAGPGLVSPPHLATFALPNTSRRSCLGSKRAGLPRADSSSGPQTARGLCLVIAMPGTCDAWAPSTCDAWAVPRRSTGRRLVPPAQACRPPNCTSGALQGVCACLQAASLEAEPGSILEGRAQDRALLRRLFETLCPTPSRTPQRRGPFLRCLGLPAPRPPAPSPAALPGAAQRSACATTGQCRSLVRSLVRRAGVGSEGCEAAALRP